MKINISKEYHFNKVEINFTVDENINEIESALDYFKYLLETLDTIDMPGGFARVNTEPQNQSIKGDNNKAFNNDSLKDKRPAQTKSEPRKAIPASDKQIDLIKRLYKDDINCDFSKLTSDDASKLIDAFYNSHENG